MGEWKAKRGLLTSWWRHKRMGQSSTCQRGIGGAVGQASAGPFWKRTRGSLQVGWANDGVTHGTGEGRIVQSMRVSRHILQYMNTAYRVITDPTFLDALAEVARAYDSRSDEVNSGLDLLDSDQSFLGALVEAARAFDPRLEEENPGPALSEMDPTLLEAIDVTIRVYEPIYRERQSESTSTRGGYSGQKHGLERGYRINKGN
ncbi:hypothetical protein Syun_019979 [Stephania yunnanensis]|uniref:Uncharacterized protein n=1 Tax=Stephania yunnanensis TaxID=152371 RepID=A0AAP0NWC3_9MAGN